MELNDRQYILIRAFTSHFWRNEANYGPAPINAIKQIWADAQKGAAHIATSALTITEVLAHKLDTKSEKAFLEAISTLHICIDAEIEICKEARLFRDYYEKHPVAVPGASPVGGVPKTCRNLSTPDAIHLATCIKYGCSEFWTFDGFDQTTRKDKTIGLLWLKNSVAGKSLVICQPSMPQWTLPGMPA